jgi:hypothetical protein
MFDDVAGVDEAKEELKEIVVSVPDGPWRPWLLQACNSHGGG